MRYAVLLLAVLALASCDRPSPGNEFFARLTALCGQAYEGRMVSTDEGDAAIASQSLVMHVAQCGMEQIRIPFHVGENRSRTWVVTTTPAGLRLKHDHRHEDGMPDAVTQYGGDTVAPGTATRQEFPADAFSREMFVANDLAVSVDNIWAVEVDPGKIFAYELRRENRFFRIEFDLTKPVPAPPPAWGAGQP